MPTCDEWRIIGLDLHRQKLMFIVFMKSLMAKSFLHSSGSILTSTSAFVFALLGIEGVAEREVEAMGVRATVLFKSVIAAVHLYVLMIALEHIRN